MLIETEYQHCSSAGLCNNLNEIYNQFAVTLFHHLAAIAVNKQCAQHSPQSNLYSFCIFLHCVDSTVTHNVLIKANIISKFKHFYSVFHLNLYIENGIG